MLDKASPTSCAVTLEQMKRGAKLKNLAQCLEVGVAVVLQCLVPCVCLLSSKPVCLCMLDALMSLSILVCASLSLSLSLSLARSLSLTHTRQMEFRIARHFLTQKDFFEGVRANVIDKDRNPKWQARFVKERKPERET